MISVGRNAFKIFFCIVGAVLGIILILLFRAYRMEATLDATRTVLLEAKKRQRRLRKERWLLSLYKKMYRIPFVGSFIKTVENLYLGICSYDDLYLSRIVAKTAVVSFNISAAVVGVQILVSYLTNRRITVLCIGCALFGIYVCGKEVLRNRYVRVERTMWEEMNRYFEAVETAYSMCRNIPEAISTGAEGLSYEMRRHAMKLVELLESSKRAEKVKSYGRSRRNNKFLKLFAQQAYQASVRGDIKDNGKSLFSENIENLRMELMQEQLAREKKTFVLQGYAFATVMPLFFMELIRAFGSGLSEGMASFYKGTGHIVVLISFLTTIVAYDLVNKARDVNLRLSRRDIPIIRKLSQKKTVKNVLKRVENKPGKFFSRIKKMMATCGDNDSITTFLLKMVLYGATMFCVVLLFVTMTHMQKREDVLSQTINVDRITVSTSAVQKEAIVTTIRAMVSDYKDADRVPLEFLGSEFRKRLNIRNEAVVKEAVTEIDRQITEYKREYLHWYEFLGCLLAGIACSVIPVFSLWYRYELVMEGKDDEVRQFQAIILMERMFPDATIEGLLEEMESFAVVYRPALRKCINSYALSREQALLKLKEDAADDIWFSQIVDGFIASFKVGIRTAFENISNNREMYERNKEFEREVALAKKKDRTDIVAILPAIAIIGGYFIIPFVVDALSGVVGLYDFIDELQKGF